MAKIPIAKPRQLPPLTPSLREQQERHQEQLKKPKGELLAEHLSIIAMERGLYYTALYDKVGENLKIFSASVDEEYPDELWLRTAIQGHIIKLRILKDDLLDFMDGNGQTLDIPKHLKL
jgi:hypothetical protein